MTRMGRLGNKYGGLCISFAPAACQRLAAQWKKQLIMMMARNNKKEADIWHLVSGMTVVVLSY